MEVIGQLHAPAALSPGKEFPLPTAYKAGWVPELPGHSAEERNSQPSLGMEP